MKTFVDRLLPLFVAGQQAGDPEELISCYLSVLSGLMVLNAQQVEGRRIPAIDMLLRIITCS